MDQNDTQGFDIPIGKPYTIQVDHPCQYKLVFQDDSFVEGLVSPNNPLTLLSTGGLKELNLEPTAIERPRIVAKTTQ